MGDRSLEQEVLQLFVRQARTVAQQIRHADADERRRLAHTLKGSARSVGAFALAECLVEVEDGSQQALKDLQHFIERVCDFVAAIGR